VIKVAEEHKIPVITGETDSVEKGALASIGIDYYQLGRTTGEMAIQIINGENPRDMAVQSQAGGNLVINQSAAGKMGVTISEELKTKAKKIIE
jgi:putative ABC transport system substrate-binding protein